ncbi:NAD/NADP-dependent octopine/nopaline dehydrogenase family protein [Afifella pfennigii]|uniref:NAD/NADP-dependent octopine/nopaline dehydrogenase family protein n=1 Tax=Afifella pfennigii TaxID=209897 RepID=UPI00047B1010|nr:NAD/NADP octopine/nopaline dehydrogenase family protein [Afifella pfennigii]
MKVTVIGGGAGGAAAVAELTAAGHSLALWSRSPETIAPILERGGIGYEGVLGEGLARPSRVTSDMGEAIAGAEVAVVMLPTHSHGAVAAHLAKAGWPAEAPVVLNPGHTGGALEFASAWRGVRADLPPIAEFSTLTYVARKYAPDVVTVTGRAKSVRAACLPGGESALEAGCALFPGASPVADVLASSLCNANLVLHPPGAVLAAAWVEATGGDFTFYGEAMTPGVGRVLSRLDEERRGVARAFGHELPGIVEEMRRIGTVEADADPGDVVAAISGGEANRKIKAPDTLQHRYYREDFGHGLLPFLELAGIAGVAVPMARALFDLGEAAVGANYREGGRTAAAMGIEGLSREELMERVRGL